MQGVRRLMGIEVFLGAQKTKPNTLINSPICMNFFLNKS